MARLYGPDQRIRVWMRTMEIHRIGLLRHIPGGRNCCLMQAHELT